MFVVPLHFAKEHKQMLAHTKKVLEYDGGSITINPMFHKLMTSLRTAAEVQRDSVDSVPNVSLMPLSA
jgi:hypothetical protein